VDHVFLGLPRSLVPGSPDRVMELMHEVARCTCPYHLRRNKNKMCELKVTYRFCSFLPVCYTACCLWQLVVYRTGNYHVHVTSTTLRVWLCDVDSVQKKPGPLWLIYNFTSSQHLGIDLIQFWIDCVKKFLNWHKTSYTAQQQRLDSLFQKKPDLLWVRYFGITINVF